MTSRGKYLVNINRLNAAEMRRLILSDNHEARDWFAKTFAGSVRSAVRELTRAFNAYRDLADAIVVEHRNAEVMLFVHNALNSVITAMHLFVSGFPVPAGNMMRQFAECLAMAMLCADKSLNVFDRYIRDRRGYPVHKCLDLVTQRRVSKALQLHLHLDEEAYRLFVRTMRFYDQLSHASALALAYSVMFTTRGGLVLGSQIDPSKRPQYKATMRQFAPAARTIFRLISILDAALDKKPVP